MLNMNDKTVLITGASRGIGRAIAKLFDQQGANLVLTARTVDNLNETAQKLSKEAVLLQCDLSSDNEVQKLCESIISTSPDVVICNAGMPKDNLAIRLSDEDWNNVIQVNLKAVASINTIACKTMMRKKWGRIINMSSIVAHTGNAGQANYAAAKAGVIAMSKTMALEFAGRGITVNCVSPGFIETDMTSGLKEEYKKELIKKIPLARMGSVNDIANAVLYLASEEAAYITGQVLHVNGGMLMP